MIFAHFGRRIAFEDERPWILPIVLISGYTGPLLNQQALSAGIDEILTKPLDFRQLAEAMARVLTRETAR